MSRNVRPAEPGEAADFAPPAWSRDLLESDRRYFEADAKVTSVPGAEIVTLDEAGSLGAGCVVQRIDAARAAAHAEAWLADVEERLRSLGSARARLYLDASHAELERELARRGYRSRVESGFACAAGARDGGAAIELSAAADEDGWRTRQELVRRSGSAPDGHPLNAGLWVAMERRKHRAGFLRPYLIRMDGEVVGAVCAAPCGSLLRMKNLIVDSAHRRRGVATGTALRFAALAAEEGFEATGCFALEGEPGLVFYPRAGYRLVVRQTEWVRDLGKDGTP